KDRKPRALALMDWILELRPSVTALVMGCLRYIGLPSPKVLLVHAHVWDRIHRPLFQAPFHRILHNPVSLAPADFKQFTGFTHAGRTFQHSDGPSLKPNRKTAPRSSPGHRDHFR